MVEQFLKNYSIVIQQKLYEETNHLGRICIYQTVPFGVTLTINDQVILTESDSFILHEMMAHPALFSHNSPKRVAIIGNHYGILQEVVKHTHIQRIDCVQPHTRLEELITQYFKKPAIKVEDNRINEYSDLASFSATCQRQPADIVIFTENAGSLKQIIQDLGPDGIMVHPALPSLLHLNTLKQLFAEMLKAGFKECQTLNFPQPSASHGWRTIILATKRAGFKRVREVDVFNRPFTTRFYNFDMHKAALVLPEFMREELGM